MPIIFAKTYNLREQEVKFVQGVAGIYFIFLEAVAITYPFATSRLIYIGMSESRQNSIAMRLRSHLTGQSGNLGIANYAKAYSVKFTFYSADVLRSYGSDNIFDMESFFLSNFLEVHGSYPICNGQAGHQLSVTGQKPSASIDWAFFE
ncbi:GIY-YIG domain-containing protein [Hyphomicrobium sp. 1Nfss2.1]|uniref:hypothetical protein n=1 Tax=Hyphomicrobium sp. 1Nfss2.1 TaxID=3413936 RepID=UPI003C7A9387